jgi:hypothetical protein
LSEVVTSKGSIFPVSFVAIFALAILGGQVVYPSPSTALRLSFCLLASSSSAESAIGRSHLTRRIGGGCGGEWAQVYAGNTFYCTDSAIPTRANCTGSSFGTGAPREWRDWEVGYAWVGDALVTTLALISREGWADIMRSGMDVTGPDTGPCVDSGVGGAAYFLAVVFFGGIVGINILIATFIDR